MVSGKDCLSRNVSFHETLDIPEQCQRGKSLMSVFRGAEIKIILSMC